MPNVQSTILLKSYSLGFIELLTSHSSCWNQPSNSKIECQTSKCLWSG